MDLSFFDNNQIKKLDIKINDYWYKYEINNEALNSIFAHIDDGDGKISELEFNILDRILKQKNKNPDEILDNKYLEDLANKLKKETLTRDELSTETVQNLNGKNFSIEALKKRYPENKYKFNITEDFIEIYDKKNNDSILRVGFYNGYIEQINTNEISNYYLDGLLYEYFDKNNFKSKFKEYFENLIGAEEKYSYSEDALIVEKSNYSIDKYSAQLSSPFNIEEIIYTLAINNPYFLYDSINAIVSSDRLNEKQKFDAIKLIIDNIINKSEANGIYVEDIKKNLEAEIKSQKNLQCFMDGKFIQSFVNKINKRNYPSENNLKEFNCNIDDHIYQGARGDCWLLAAIIAANNKAEGKALLDKAVSVNKDESITVELKGVGKKYTFNPKDIQVNRDLASGNPKVRAIEMAFEAYFYEQRGVNGRIDIEGNFSTTAFEILFGKKTTEASKYSIPWSIKKNKDSIDNQLKILPAPYEYAFSNDSKDYKAQILEHTKKILISKINNPKMALTTSYNGNGGITFTDTNNEEKFIIKNHAYAIEKADEEYVYLINPHNTESNLPVPWNVFLENYPVVHECYFE